MCRDSHSSLRGIPSVCLSNSFMAEGSHSASQPASQPGLFCSVCLISQFTRCFIGSYYGHHGDAIRFNGILFLGQSVIKGKKKQKTKHTHRQEDKGSQNTLLLGKSLSSLLNPSFTLCQSQQTQSPHPPLHVKHGRSNFELSSLIAHIWI